MQLLDLIWAPISSYLLTRMYANRSALATSQLHQPLNTMHTLVRAKIPWGCIQDLLVPRIVQWEDGFINKILLMNQCWMTLQSVILLACVPYVNVCQEPISTSVLEGDFAIHWHPPCGHPYLGNAIHKNWPNLCQKMWGSSAMSSESCNQGSVHDTQHDNEWSHGVELIICCYVVNVPLYRRQTERWRDIAVCHWVKPLTAMQLDFRRKEWHDSSMMAAAVVAECRILDIRFHHWCAHNNNNTALSFEGLA